MKRPDRILLAACSWLLCAGCAEEPPAPEPVVRPVKIFEVGGVSAEGRREYPGTVSAVLDAELSFEVPGRVVEFPVNEGQEVEKGTILAKLDPRDFQAQFDSANALYRDARVDWERAEVLFKEGVTAKAERDRRRAYFEVQEANLREAQKALDDTVLRAPFSGVVARRLIRDFRNVPAKQPVLILQDASSLEIEIHVPERDLTRPPAAGIHVDEITRRTDPRVALTAVPDREFPARVQEYATTADPTTRTFAVTLAFDRSEDVNVFPGMTARVSILAEQLEMGVGPRVPARAVASDEAGNPFVWVISRETMKAERRAVELGELEDGEIFVTSGLEPGDWLASSGVHQLREGMQVSRFGE